MRARWRLGGKLLSQEVVRNSTEPHSTLDIAHRAHRAFLHTRGFRPCAKSAPKKARTATRRSGFCLPVLFLILPLPFCPRHAVFGLPRYHTPQSFGHLAPQPASARTFSRPLVPFSLPQIPLQSYKIQFFYKKALFLFRASLVYPLQTSIPF